MCSTVNLYKGSKYFLWENFLLKKLKVNTINKMLLTEPEKYRDAINEIKKDIAYMPIELKKKLEEENIIL